MRADPVFLAQLNAWAATWAAQSKLGPIKAVWSFGASTDTCASFHQVGRAFDIARLDHARGTISCRYDLWNPGSATQLGRYWRLAASLHRDFADTICYPYNAVHHNHIHIDNSVNGQSATTFDPATQVQVPLIQHACRHVFGVDVATSGAWDDATENALRAVQARVGITTPVGQPAGWRAFLTAVGAA